MSWLFGLAPSPWGSAIGRDTWRGMFGRLWRSVMGLPPYIDDAALWRDEDL
jgi:hypothetical protein